MCLTDISKLSESFVTIASFFLELKKNFGRGQKWPPPGLNRVKVFNEAETKDLVEAIVVFAELGFGMTSWDIRELVQSYVEHNDHQHAKKPLITGEDLATLDQTGWKSLFKITTSLQSKQLLLVRLDTTRPRIRLLLTIIMIFWVMSLSVWELRIDQTSYGIVTSLVYLTNHRNLK